MKRFNILLGYDDPDLLEAIGWALEEKGYNITQVSSAEAVLETLIKNDFDLILIDLCLEKIADVDLLPKVKDINAETMVIILCCKEDVIYSHDALRDDVDDYIFKPCSKEKLWVRVANCLEKLELKRSIALLKPQIRFLDQHVLKTLIITMEGIKNQLVIVEEILEQIIEGESGEMDGTVGTKLRALYRIVTKLNGRVEEELRRVSKLSRDFHIEQKMPDWREDILNPVLDNISSGSI
jgi:DNA-binding NtrC family response regulator